MPIENDVGFGPRTAKKIARLQKVFEWHQKVTKNVVNKLLSANRTYRYIDLTAGPGITPTLNIPGAALTFARSAESHTIWMPYRADLIERNPANIDSLKNVISTEFLAGGWTRGQFHYHNDDNRNVIGALLDKPDANEYGLAFLDPSGEMPDADLLAHIAKMRPKMEVLIYMAASTVKRERAAGYTENTLADLKMKIGKNYWIGTPPAFGDAHQWILLMGSNADTFKDYTAQQLFRYDTEQGQEAFDKANLTRDERRKKAQNPLDFDSHVTD